MASGYVQKKTLKIIPSTGGPFTTKTNSAPTSLGDTIYDLNFSGRVLIKAYSDTDLNDSSYTAPVGGYRVLTYFGAAAGSSKTGYGKLIKLNYLDFNATTSENYVGLRSESQITSNLNTGYTLDYYIYGAYIDSTLIDIEE